MRPNFSPETSYKKLQGRVSDTWIDSSNIARVINANLSVNYMYCLIHYLYVLSEKHYTMHNEYDKRKHYECYKHSSCCGTD